MILSYAATVNGNSLILDLGTRSTEPTSLLKLSKLVLSIGIKMGMWDSGQVYKPKGWVRTSMGEVSLVSEMWKW